MTEKRERFGCLSKSLEAFLYMKPEKRRKKYGHDINKRYERVVKNVNNSISDIMLAYRNLPDEQKNKINLFTHIENLIDFTHTEEFEKSPDKLISQTRTGLYALLRGRIANDQKINKLATPDFERAVYWLEYLAPKNPTSVGGPM